MSDTKLDYPSSNRPAGRQPNPVYSGDTKLDLPGTLEEFERLDRTTGGSAIALHPFRKKESSEAVADGAGDAVCSFGAPFIGWSWDIQRMVVLGGGTVRVFVGGRTDGNVVDLTGSGTADVADENSPIYVEEGERVEVVFAGVTPGVLCTANAQILYRPGN